MSATKTTENFDQARPGSLPEVWEAGVTGKGIAGAGAVGVWTKADSVTSFDDFTYGK